MIIGICAFSSYGRLLIRQLIKACPDIHFECREDELLREWVGMCFKRRIPLVFVGASGIAIRAIAPFVEDKMCDSPVIVMDDKGEHVIPLLSGHMGGANALARILAKASHGQAVITTATDIHGLFAVDVFAKRNGFWIANRDGIAKVSSKLLAEETVTIFIEKEILFDFATMPKELLLVSEEEKKQADICILTESAYNSRENANNLITLVAKEYVLGIGCKKGKTADEIRAFLQEKCPYHLEKQICEIASIDLKKEEEGLMELAQFYHMDFVTYAKEELLNAQGEFSNSAFVENITGVDCVCERAAVLAADGSSKDLVCKKTAQNGITFAVAKRNVNIQIWKETDDE